MSVAGSSDGEIDAESDGFQDETVQETSEEASETKEQDDLLDRYFHAIKAHVYGGEETESEFLWEENVGRLFLKLAEEIVPGIAEFAARKSASSKAEKQLMASTQRLENMSTKRQEIRTRSSKLEKELQQLREESAKIDSEIQKELDVAKAAKKRMTEQIQGAETSKMMERAQAQIENMAKQISREQQTTPRQSSWAEVTCRNAAPVGRKAMRTGSGTYVSSQPENMSAEQREEAAIEYEIPNWANGMPFINLTVSSITGGPSRAIGSVRGFLQSCVGSELKLLWVERATAATVELFVPVGQWAVTCKYLAENGVWIHHQLEPTDPRPGGAATPARAHKEAWERWTNWAAGEPNRPFTRLGKVLLQKFPLEPQETQEAEPQCFAQSRISEPGEIEDTNISAPEQQGSNAGTMPCRQQNQLATEEAGSKRTCIEKARATNSFATLTAKDSMDTDDWPHQPEMDRVWRVLRRDHPTGNQ
ncbi:hypothetical protein H4R99_007907 [Coemansia sp. RSA 1722]|nr:hypothetical protein LPJ57_005627 [Coemansia sp. RSA 486]KAJ2221840.1 hypothetical protein IWW45_008764 [Coemansia sp. RSA 485]KAJ2588150.1 hypothetical protein H4R99_007907 [Coemansia sp. RSA 1722]